MESYWKMTGTNETSGIPQSKQVYLLCLYLHKNTNFVCKHVTHNLYRKKQIISVNQVITYDCLASEYGTLRFMF